jgi:hypothetical protein
MPILNNPHHEKMAQELALGASQAEAHKLAGYTGDRKSASDMVKTNPDILERVKELQAEAAKETVLTLRELDENIKFMAVSAKAEPVFNDNGEEIGARVNFAGLGKALELYGKRLRAYTDNVVVEESIGDINENDLDKAIKLLAKEVTAQNTSGGKTKKT